MTCGSPDESKRKVLEFLTCLVFVLVVRIGVMTSKLLNVKVQAKSVSLILNRNHYLFICNLIKLVFHIIEFALGDKHVFLLLFLLTYVTHLYSGS